MQTETLQEKVSVIMPTYNAGRYIAEAVSSVLSQSYGNWELLIADDQSSDDTRKILTPFLEDPRIRYHCLAQKGGVAAARNWALAHADGEYVAFLDSDDLWTPDKLEKQLRFMKDHPSGRCRFSCTGYERMDDEGKCLGMAILPPRKANYWKMFRLGNCVGNSTAIYDRRFFCDARVPLIPRRNDYALWLQLLRGGELVYGMEDITMYYRVHQGSVSYKKWTGIPSIWKLYRKVEGMNPLLSAYGVLSWAFVKGTGIGRRIRRSERESRWT